MIKMILVEILISLEDASIKSDDQKLKRTDF